MSDLTDCEKRCIQKTRPTATSLEKEIRIKYAKVKAEYDKQKVAYLAEYKEQMRQLEEKRQVQVG